MPCTIKIKILTIPISLSSTSLITILSPLPDFMHLSVSSLLYHSHPPHPIYTKQHTTIKCPMCFSISDSLASTVSNCTVAATVMPQRFQIHSNHGSCTTWNEISGRFPSDSFVLSFKEEMNIYFCWEITRYMMSLVSNSWPESQKKSVQRKFCAQAGVHLILRGSLKEDGMKFTAPKSFQSLTGLEVASTRGALKCSCCSLVSIFSLLSPPPPLILRPPLTSYDGQL